MQVSLQELVEVHYPASNSELVAIETKLIEKAYVEYKKEMAYRDGDLVEYEGNSFLESELILACPDKMMFLVKDTVSHLTRAFKKSLNPFLIARLDLQSI